MDSASLVSPDVPTTTAPAPADPTGETYGPLQNAYAFFNLRLFSGRLPGALITLRSEKRAMGYFSRKRFATKDKRNTDEIALNPQYFGVVPIEMTLATFLHELVHQYQAHHGKPGRGRYHNREWGQLMRERGLEPSSTGQPGGKTLGDHMAHFIVEDGPFDIACRDLLSREYRLAWFDRFPPSSAARLVGMKHRFPVGGRKIVDNTTQGPVRSPVDLDVGEQAPPLPDELAPVPEHPPLLLQGDERSPLTVRDLEEPVPVVRDVQELHRMLGVEDDERVPRRPVSKLKYTCPTCGTNVWGKPGLSLICGLDRAAFGCGPA